MKREAWDKAVDERDTFRRTLALISAWRVSSGTNDPQLDTLLNSVGETRGTGEAMLGIINSVRSGAR